jgi:hypothetical protein
MSRNVAEEKGRERGQDAINEVENDDVICTPRTNGNQQLHRRTLTDPP